MLNFNISAISQAFSTDEDDSLFYGQTPWIESLESFTR